MNDRKAVAAVRQFRKVDRQPLLRWIHKCAMERRRNVQFYSTLRAFFFQDLASSGYRFRISRDNDLRGRVDIRRAAYLTVGRFLATLRHGIGVKTEYGGHRTEIDGNGFLHIRSSMSYGPYRVCEIKNTCG